MVVNTGDTDVFITLLVVLRDARRNNFQALLVQRYAPGWPAGFMAGNYHPTGESHVRAIGCELKFVITWLELIKQPPDFFGHSSVSLARPAAAIRRQIDNELAGAVE
jgi:hypothetical protein